ncbi:hypothetical protein [Methylobacterium sp. J-068]|uniref:hypothetical protein n=1 Tax=Methylobacterium sp. J-068 TaxID=2836649 RepID=UPI001FBA0864|nr:hypothetical protein [Methylobacterium sp. J-068]MCJ2034716.1 hypothetical protein [Methylobacterium sp. J-068]
MWLTRRHLLPLVAAGFAGLPVRAARLDTLPLGPIALNGFDAVSYFLGDSEVARPEPGLAAHEAVWRGKTWRFARMANEEAFRRAPSIYAPRLGGFDPLGILDGHLVDTDPLVFARVPDAEGVERLYLLRNAEHRARFIADPALAAQAEARWPDLRDQIDRDFLE